MTDRSLEARLRQLIEKWTARAEAAHDKHGLDSGTDDWKGLGEAYEICADELEALLTDDASLLPVCQESETEEKDDQSRVDKGTLLARTGSTATTDGGS